MISALIWITLPCFLLGGPSVFLWFMHKFNLPTM
jgi:hypothetical protein